MWKGKKMIIAVTYDHGQVFQHFGRTEQFKLYLVVDGEVKGAQVIGTNGAGHGALAGFLTGVGVDVLICGGMGPGAQMALQDAGIKIYAGASGSADMAVMSLLEGTLPENGEANCDHHGHGEGHSCHEGGGHGCHGGGAGHGCHGGPGFKGGCHSGGLKS